MIFVNRSEPAPASLSAPASESQASAAEAYYRTWRPGRPAFATFTRYKEYDVQQSLRRVFSWKCAYCERQLDKGSFEVEHYRPKGRVKGCNHPGYWWLALEWTNLLPTCAGCNKALHQHLVTAEMTLEDVERLQTVRPRDLHGKATQFPVSAVRLVAKSNDHFAEEPLLIDPTRTDPEPELKWRFDCRFSVVEAADKGEGPSLVGQETIKCVALNRLDLVENRTQISERLRTIQINIMDGLEQAHEGADPAVIRAEIEKAVARIDDLWTQAKANQPYAGMVRAFMNDFTAQFEVWVAKRGYVVA